MANFYCLSCDFSFDDILEPSNLNKNIVITCDCKCSLLINNGLILNCGKMLLIIDLNNNICHVEDGSNIMFFDYVLTTGDIIKYSAYI